MVDKAIADLTAASVLTGAEKVHVDQGGNSRRTTARDIANTGNQYDTEIALLNMALADALNVAQFIGDTGNRYADSFDALTYIDNAGATNLDVSEAGVLKSTASVGGDATATHTSATQSGNTASAQSELASAWLAVDKVAGDASNNNTWISNGKPAWWQYQFASAQTIASYTVTSPGNAASSSPQDWTLKGSNTGAFAGEEVTLDTVTGETSWSATEKRTFTVDAPGSYTYYRLDVSANNGGANILIDEIELISQGVTNNMTVETTGLSAASAPSTMRAYLTIEAIDSITLNTDLTAELSRDNGTTWATATLSELFTVGSNAVLDTGEVDVSGQPSGTTPVLRIKTLNNKSVKIHAHYVYWS